jgi:hypothetical protein
MKKEAQKIPAVESVVSVVASGDEQRKYKNQKTEEKTKETAL